jgi:hypothetical protein
MTQLKINRRHLVTGAAACCGLGLTAVTAHTQMARRGDCPCGYRTTDADRKWECALQANPDIPLERLERVIPGGCALHKG